MKTITNVFILFFLISFFTPNLEAQCNASFTYSMGTNGEVTFFNTSTTSSTHPLFYWDFGLLQLVPVSGDTTITFPANGSVDIRLRVFDASCTSQDNQTIIITNSQPCNITASYTYSVDSQGYVHFTNTSNTPTNTPVDYHWEFGDGHNSSLENPVTYYVPGGIYTVSLDVWLSLSPSCITSYSINVTAPTYTPYPCSNLNSGFALMSTPSSYSWNAYVGYPSNVSAINAVWSWGDGTTTNALYPTHTYSVAGVYNICVNTTITCNGSDYTNVFCYTGNNSELIQTINVIDGNSVGVKEFKDKDSHIDLFPNPNSGKFNLSFLGDDFINQTMEYSIIDVYGSVISKGVIILNKGLTKEINLENLNNGVYFFMLENKAYKFYVIK